MRTKHILYIHGTRPGYDLTSSSELCSLFFFAR